MIRCLVEATLRPVAVDCDRLLGLKRLMVCAVVCICSRLNAQQIILPGGYLGFGTPNPPYASGNAAFSLGLEYDGVPESRIGTSTWFMGPGVFDLTSDPHMTTFLEHATNGIHEQLWVIITDGNGHQGVHGTFENGLWGTAPMPDLAGLPASGLQLESLDFVDPVASIVVRWQVLGTPEPATAALLLIGAGCILNKRRRLDTCRLKRG